MLVIDMSWRNVYTHRADSHNKNHYIIHHQFSILLIDHIGLTFSTTVCIILGSILSIVPLNIYSEIILQDKLENHQSTILIRGRIIH